MVDDENSCMKCGSFVYNRNEVVVELLATLTATSLLAVVVKLVMRYQFHKQR